MSNIKQNNFTVPHHTLEVRSVFDSLVEDVCQHSVFVQEVTKRHTRKRKKNND